MEEVDYKGSRHYPGDVAVRRGLAHLQR